MSNGWRCHQAVQRPDSDPQQLSPPPPSIPSGPPPSCRHKPGSSFLSGDSISSAHSTGNVYSNLTPAVNRCLVSCLVLQGQRVSDPVELLRQCEEALRDRPPRFHRKFTHVSDGSSAPSSPIRVMQWNILAQGRLR